ncbi:MAG: hypothetical protein WCR69_03155 [Sulfuricurvum sp.]
MELELSQDATKTKLGYSQRRSSLRRQRRQSTKGAGAFKTQR